MTVSPSARLTLHLLSTWGDRNFVGLAGLEVLNRDGRPVEVRPEQLAAAPRDLRSTAGNEHDVRRLENLVRAPHNTASDPSMWLAPFQTDGHGTGTNTLEIDFGRRVELGGLRVWNYSRDVDTSFRGVQAIEVLADGSPIGPGRSPHTVALRKAPGTDRVDFSQTIDLGAPAPAEPAAAKVPWNFPPAEPSNYDVAFAPTGLTLRLVLCSTWGDQHYIGLNGVEVLDDTGHRCDLRGRISALPHSVSELNGNRADPRTPSKLADGENQTWDSQHMWLAPFEANSLTKLVDNIVLISLPEPTAIGAIRIWNYSKTSARGVQDWMCYVDDHLVYCGELRRAPEQAGGADFGQTVRFGQGSSRTASEQTHVALFNDGRLVGGPAPRDHAASGVVESVPSRPMTSAGHR